MKQRLNRLSDIFTRRLNNISLLKKFMLMFVVCVLFPVTLSAVLFSVNINKALYNSETENMEYVLTQKATQLKHIFNEGTVVSGVIASNSAVKDLAQIRFMNNAQYYDYFIDKDFKTYYKTYVESRQNIDDVKVYIDNDTIVSGGLIWKASEDIKKNGWYIKVMSSDNQMELCVSVEVNDGIPVEQLSVVRKLYERKADSRVIGLIKTDLNMAAVRKALMSDREHMSVTLVNTFTGLSYDPADGQIYSGLTVPEKPGRSGGYIYGVKDFDNVSFLKDWEMVGRYESGVLRRRQAVNTLLIVLVHMLISALMLVILMTIYRSMNERIEVLEDNIGEVSKGIYRELQTDTGTDEIGHMLSCYNSMVRHINILINDVYELEVKNKSIEAENIRTELNFLQSQVNPHFIFNVLNAMLVVAVKNGYSELTAQISGLAKMIRRLLDWSEDYEPLENELGFIGIYLDLEKFRFGDLFEYTIDTDGEAQSCCIPKMVVQPLVENSCRHGLQGITGKRRLRVSARVSGGKLVIKVGDNGKGISEDKLQEINDGLEQGEFRGHIGLKNVYRRLKLYLGEAADMNIASVENEGTEITITITDPQRVPGDE